MPKKILYLFSLITCFFFANHLKAQRVGIVLSGGGADALAHIGVLRALEENNIPIDYITGTSMGALIAALYASGHSPEEMTTFFTSNAFYRMANGNVEEKYTFFFTQSDFDASMATLTFTKDSIFKPVFPTSIITPLAMDFEIVEKLAAPAAKANYNFDSLFIPFRCVASDIKEKKPVILKDGSLSSAVRASMSYPFYIKPIRINGELLFDGGLYNNFPVDVMCNDFEPQIIIGSNVGNENTILSEDDVVSQIRAMLISPQNHNHNCTDFIQIEPNVDNGVFKFERVSEIIDSGYYQTIRNINEIKSNITRRTSKEFLDDKRNSYKKNLEEIRIHKEVKIEGLGIRQKKYATKTLSSSPKKTTYLNINTIKKNYFRLGMNPKIYSLFPNLILHTNDSLYTFYTKAKVQRDLQIKIGGNLASRPVSHAYLGVVFNRLSTYGVELEGSSSFGRLYAGGHFHSKFDFSTQIPFSVEPFFTIHRFNFFQSRFNTLFTEDRPNYIILRERMGGVNLSVPIGNHLKLTSTSQYFHFYDDYYQTNNFSPSDTADQTTIEGVSNSLCVSQNTLDNKQFPTEGNHFSISATYVTSNELFFAGNTGGIRMNSNIIKHNWLVLKLQSENYFNIIRKLTVGTLLEAVYSNMPMFNNYSSTINRAPSFSPTPDSRTMFLESFRAHQYTAGGLKIIHKFSRNWQMRYEGYVFQPIQEITKNEATLEAEYDKNFDKRYTILSSTLVYTSPIGPLSASVNYYYNVPSVVRGEKTPLTFLFNFGYLIFNKKALD